MNIMIASTPNQIEDSRVLINKIFPQFQHILRQDRELVSLSKWDEILKGKDRELIVACEQGRVIGTVVLGMTPELAFIAHLAKDDSSPKGLGIDLLKFAENRAKLVYRRPKMQLSVVSHPQCRQAQLQQWYIKQGYSLFDETRPTVAQSEDWEQEYRETVVFKWFKKYL